MSNDLQVTMGAPGRLRASDRRGRQRQRQPLLSTRQLAPASFLCPIHLELMADPVTLHTGMTYDRVSIEKWLTEGHNTCPVTNQPLLHKYLIPNHALQRSILTWIDSIEHPSPAELRELLLNIDTEYSLCRLATTVLPLLDDEEKASLLNDPESILAEDVARSLVAGASVNAAAEVLHAICEANPTCVGVHPEVIRTLVTSLQVRELSVLRCLSSLCRWNRRNCVVAINECQVVGVLMELLSDGVHVEYCCAILESLAHCPEGRDAICEHPYGIVRLVESLLGVSEAATEYAVGALWGLMALAADRRSVMDVASQAGVFSMLLMVMSSECCQNAKSQSREMLKMLNEVYHCSSSHTLNANCGVVIKRRRGSH